MELSRDNTLGKLILIQNSNCIKYIVADTISGLLMLSYYINIHKDIDKNKLNVCRVSTNKIELGNANISCTIDNYRARTFMLSFNNISIKAKQVI